MAVLLGRGRIVVLLWVGALLHALLPELIKSLFLLITPRLKADITYNRYHYKQISLVPDGEAISSAGPAEPHCSVSRRKFYIYIGPEYFH